MIAGYFVKPKADRDLDDYADYLAENASLDVALRFFDAAYSTFALIATQPNMGWRSRVKYPGLEALRVFRVSGFEHMLILYRTLPKVWTSFASSTAPETFGRCYAVKGSNEIIESFEKSPPNTLSAHGYEN